MFICMQKKQLHPSRFSWDIAKILKTCHFEYFKHACHVILLTCRKLSLFNDQNINFIPHVFWKYCEDMRSYFGYFGLACLRTPKMIVPTCRTLRFYPQIKNTIHHSLISWDITFSRILQFDWAAVFWPITREPEFCHIRNWRWNINYNITITIYFVLWGHFGPFFPEFWQKWIFLGKRVLSVFKYSNYLPSCKKSEKTIEPFLRKMPNWQTDG